LLVQLLPSAAASAAARLAEGERGKAARPYGDRAVALLGRARQGGHFKDAELVRQEGDFDSLRGREDYEKLVAELEGGGRK
jgi:hypothetical protein